MDELKPDVLFQITRSGGEAVKFAFTGTLPALYAVLAGVLIQYPQFIQVVERAVTDAKRVIEKHETGDDTLNELFEQRPGE